ncbi:MAG: hypothetical protein FWF38_00900 [Spirochaetaceae bacterium]|nr:hypothetical protein [Spirochaetaceae bacterium]
MSIAAILLAATFSSLIIFLAYIYPNLKKPIWERKIVSANYLRLRNRASLADDVLILAIKRAPHAWQLYRNLFASYATPWDMKKIYDVLVLGVKTTDNPGIIASTAWCHIEEGEFEKAEEMLKREDVEDALLEHGLNYLPLLYFKQEKYEECEKAFVSFYKKVYINGLEGDPNETNEEKIFADLSPDELVLLVIARKKLDKNWWATAKILPLSSVHEEKNWTSYYKKLLKQKENLKVETGIYGPPEKLFSLREKELNDRIETVKDYLKIK